MGHSSQSVIIVGAGVSGLVAAKVLEDHGYQPLVLESSDRVGGRVKTDIVDGHQLDHGFQVLLTAYPAAQKYLNYEALDLQHFTPGASVFSGGQQRLFGDPLRSPSLLWHTALSDIATLSDKLKIFYLTRKLKKKSVEDIFSSHEVTTRDHLIKIGFSETVINQFFIPFFSGIFLETNLDTSSRMFEFVFKMFSEGHAAIPKGGMEMIPQQLRQGLSKTSFRFNCPVEAVKQNQVTLNDGETLNSRAVIVATDPYNILEHDAIVETNWKSSKTYYFETNKISIKKRLIGLVPDPSSVINNIFYHSSLSNDSHGPRACLSVTVVDDQGLSSSELIKRVHQDLHKVCGVHDADLIKEYNIPKALPIKSKLRNSPIKNGPQTEPGIFLAGDTVLNGSLNAAMIAGESAAYEFIEFDKN